MFIKWIVNRCGSSVRVGAGESFEVVFKEIYVRGKRYFEVISFFIVGVRNLVRYLDWRELGFVSRDFF